MGPTLLPMPRGSGRKIAVALEESDSIERFNVRWN